MFSLFIINSLALVSAFQYSRQPVAYRRLITSHSVSLGNWDLSGFFRKGESDQIVIAKIFAQSFIDIEMKKMEFEMKKINSTEAMEMKKMEFEMKKMNSTEAMEMKKMEFEMKKMNSTRAMEMKKMNFSRETAFEVQNMKFQFGIAMAFVGFLTVFSFGLNLRAGLTGKVTDIEKFFLSLKSIKLVGGALTWTSVSTVVKNFTNRLTNSIVRWLSTCRK